MFAGTVNTNAGDIPRLKTGLDWRDWLGAFKARWMINRRRYFVQPGLYATGNPAPDSPVLVTANYKLSVDALRRTLGGRDFWILVLDTKGINVWCAAGKGTFGTDELCTRLRECRVSEIVEHRTLILPQLGAPGVAAHEVSKQTGFQVVYGPVRSEDINVFIDSDFTAAPEMRQVTFPLDRRLVLIPVELITAVKYGLLAALLFLLAGGIGRGGYSADAAVGQGLTAAVFLGTGITAGTILVPALLPWLPGRAFSLKGLAAGAGLTGILLAIFPGIVVLAGGRLTLTAWMLAGLAVASFTGMNFTGSSTYTSLSGVRKEMRIAVPLQFAGAGLSLLLWIAGRIWSI